MSWDYERLFQSITELVMHHSPSGVESEINQYLLEKFAQLGVEAWCDRADNIIAKIPGKTSALPIAITAHKDEIGAIVKTIGTEGKVEVRRLGGAFPWVYGEGVVDLLGDNSTISGILSFGSRHVSHESPQKVQQEDTAVKWENAWIETKSTVQQLETAGIRPGTRMVIGKHRKHPIRLNDYIASYTLDNKASVAILLTLAETLKNPKVDVYLVASAKEEVGAIGALYFTQNQRLDSLIALEICPLSAEYPIEDGEKPVLLVQDAYGIYDEHLNGELRQTAQHIEMPVQLATLSGFGSDASIAMKFGHIARGACLSFPTQNTHGYEIAHLGAIANCIQLLKAFCESDISS
ncbi:M42 family metallopeptidase [Calothrix sp. 336/3]|uniref:M42 family metallopeptidase n=1 Tax=Calothrix sp. 336/3 TaxID=1337936 RepID=UPI0004E421EB|nr:M28 family peptidase [Calothrix sp. 336/3]AKG22884.1 peptidase M42 [Calothrix sp. 336/3]